jgi:hypothetical protein
MMGCKVWRTLALVAVCLSCISLHASDRQYCRFAKTKTVHNLPLGFALSLTPISGKDGEGCLARLVDARKRMVFSTAEWDAQLVWKGQDLNGDSVPDIVLEGYSGGAHCCWTYYIIALGPKPGILREFENERPADFLVDGKSGKVEIHTLDGAFDYFESSHGSSPFPDVYFRVEGKRLVDISREHVADYDRTVQALKAKLSSKDRKVFRQAENPEEMRGWEHVSTNVLSIVLAYLYSGRKPQAHAALQNMWPPFDQERIWKLILETRAQGIIRYAK